jgi:hypothetical protein
MKSARQAVHAMIYWQYLPESHYLLSHLQMIVRDICG